MVICKLPSVTAMICVSSMGELDEIASLVLYLCPDKADFVTGTNYPIDGGFLNMNT